MPGMPGTPGRRRVPLVCDASSNIMSRPVDVSKYALIYAGAQKNMGPSGVTLVIVRDDLLSRIPENLPTMLDYRIQVENKSLYNTPNTWGIYMISLVCEWLERQGGLTEMKRKNEEKELSQICILIVYPCTVLNSPLLVL